MASIPRFAGDTCRTTIIAGKYALIVWWAALLGFGATTADLEVGARTKTIKTSEGGSTSSKTAHFVERTILSVNMRGFRGAEFDLTCYFVARNVQSQALKYCGFEKRTIVNGATNQKLEFESQPVPYSQAKDRNSTRESKRGDVAYGWVVIASTGGQEIAVKASPAELVQWVRKNPPRQRTLVSP